jgi:AraC-like DNA-binding protein
MLLDKLLTNLAIHVEPFALCQIGAGWRLSLPGPRGVMVHFVLQGRGAIRGPRERAKPLAQHWIAIVPASARHALETSSGVRHELRIDDEPVEPPVHHIVAGSGTSPALVVACGVVFARFGRLLGLFDHLREVITVDMSETPQVAATFQGILAEQADPGPGSNVLTAALMSQCLVHVFRHLCADSQRRMPWLAALGDARLGRAIDLILEDPAADHTVESLAQSAGMSRSAFAEHFASAFGRSPIAFVHAIRMERAAVLLRDGTASIDNVGHQVGYASRSHFSRAFKKHVGIPPNKFRDSDDLSPAIAAGRLDPAGVERVT